VSVINGSSATPEELSKALNRSVESIKKVRGINIREKSEPTVNMGKAPSTPDAPEELPKGYAKRFFEIDDSKNPGKKKSGIAIMTEGGSGAGDDFLKNSENGLLPMSSKHKDCIVKAQ
jgi:hypothetical protein